MRLDASGRLSDKALAAKLKNPSFLAIHPDGKHLVAVSEVESMNGQPTGGVSSFSLHPSTGLLTPINAQATGGGTPCHISIDSAGTTVLTANYGGGSVATLPIADGKLAPVASIIQHQGSSVNRQRQEGPHAHSINVDAGNRFAVAADLGTDQVFIYRLDAKTSTIQPNEPAFVRLPAGSGPRHFAFHPGGKYAFTNGELTSTLTSMRYDADRGALEVVETLSTLPEGYDGKDNTTAEVVAHPSGKFVFVSNRGHDSVAVFSFDERTGKLSTKGQVKTQGRVPRNFAVDPSGRFLLAANQDSGTVVVFEIDQATGDLKATGAQEEVPMPVCVRFVPAE
jgi:6-phosphogluconolactonase